MLELLGNSRIIQSKEFPVVTGGTVTAEGLCLIQAFEDGLEKAGISNATTTNKFLGFSYGETFTPATKSKVETLSVPASSTYTITLAHVPTAGQIRIYDNTGSAVITAGNPSNSAEYSISALGVITFNVARASHSMTITYRYAPTAFEIMSEDHVRITSYSATDYISSIGCIQQGEIFTDQFDASVNWAGYTSIKACANGLLSTNSGTGTVITGAVLTHVPTAELPYVGIRFNAA